MVAAETSVATIEPLIAHQGSFRPPRKKSRIVACLPESTAPSTVAATRYPATITQSNVERPAAASIGGDMRGKGGNVRVRGSSPSVGEPKIKLQTLRPDSDIQPRNPAWQTRAGY